MEESGNSLTRICEGDHDRELVPIALGQVILLCVMFDSFYFTYRKSEKPRNLV